MNVKINSYDINLTTKEIEELITSIDVIYTEVFNSNNDKVLSMLQPLLELKHSIVGFYNA
mgnify:FL=1